MHPLQNHTCQLVTLIGQSLIVGMVSPISAIHLIILSSRSLYHSIFYGSVNIRWCRSIYLIFIGKHILLFDQQDSSTTRFGYLILEAVAVLRHTSHQYKTLAVKMFRYQ